LQKKRKKNAPQLKKHVEEKKKSNDRERARRMLFPETKAGSRRPGEKTYQVAAKIPIVGAGRTLLRRKGKSLKIAGHVRENSQKRKGLCRPWGADSVYSQCPGPPAMAFQRKGGAGISAPIKGKKL